MRDLTICALTEGQQLPGQDRRPPGQPQVARALAPLVAEINTSPPTLPRDCPPITYYTLRQSQ